MDTVRKRCPECGEEIVEDVDGSTSVIRCGRCGKAVAVTSGTSAPQGDAPGRTGSGTFGRGEMCGVCRGWAVEEVDEPGAGLCQEPDSPRYGEKTTGGDWCRECRPY